MPRIVVALLAFLSIAATSVQAETRVQIGHNPATATSAFQFEGVPRPRATDAAKAGEWSVVDGKLDANSGPLLRLSDGIVPRSADQPQENVFFNAGSDGGRIRLHLDRLQKIENIPAAAWPHA